MVQIDSEWPILAVLQLFQYFPIEVVLIHSEQLILAVLQLFQYFPTKVVQIDWNGQFGLLASFLIISYQSALKLFEIATKVFRTYNFHFKC